LTKIPIKFPELPQEIKGISSMGAGRNLLAPLSPLPSPFFLILTLVIFCSAHLHYYATLAAGARRGALAGVRLRKGGAVPPSIAVVHGPLQRAGVRAEVAQVGEKIEVVSVDRLKSHTSASSSTAI
jgi:hypothetical protein